MHKSILIYADFNSAFARDWLRLLEHASINVIPVSSNFLRAPTSSRIIEPTGYLLKYKNRIRNKGILGVSNHRSNGSFAREMRQLLITMDSYNTLNKAIKKFNPDIVHAMRTTYEGVVANWATPKSSRLAVSVWGNDFDLHGSSNAATRYLLNKLLKNVQGLHADACKDLECATNEYSLDASVELLHAPTSGGVPVNELKLDISKLAAKRKLGFSENTFLIVNPRGTRSYIDSDVFFKAAGYDDDPNNIYFAVDVPLQPGWQPHKIRPSGNRLCSGKLDRPDFFLLLRAADIVVSPSRYDGTPNSVLEALGSGAFLALTDLAATNSLVSDDHLREVFDVNEPHTLFELITTSKARIDFSHTAEKAQKLVQDKYSKEKNKVRILNWYDKILQSST